MSVIGIFVVLVLVILSISAIVYIVGVFNSLVALKFQISRAYGNIDIILKQRYDEIPLLVQVIEQFAHYEKNIINELLEARKSYRQAEKLADKFEASNKISAKLLEIVAIAEAYPDLKSSQHFVHLQERISILENTLSDRRETYNEAVTNFNTKIEQFPDLIVARMLNYRSFQLFQVDTREMTIPKVKMNLPGVG